MAKQRITTSSQNTMLALVGVALVVCGWLGWAPVALASSVGVDGSTDTLVVRADARERNGVAVAAGAGGSVLVSDAAGMRVGADCVRRGALLVVCREVGRRVRIVTGDGADQVRVADLEGKAVFVELGAGADRYVSTGAVASVAAGTGADVVVGG